MLQQLINDLTAAQIRVWVEDGNLKFSAPKGALTPALRERLVANKPELIALLEQQQAKPTQDDTLSDLTAATDELSFAQQRLLFMADTFGASTAYNMPAIYDIAGPLDANKLQQSLDQLLALHSSLRLAFHKQSGVYHTELQQPTQWPFELIATNDADLPAQQQQAIAHQFDVSCAPLAKAFLFRLSETKHRLVLNLHHVISDGWSHQLLWQQLWQLYQGDNTVSAPSHEYGHFVAWQQQWLASGDYQRQQQFWSQYLADAPQLIELPLDKPRPSQPTYQGAVHTFELDASLTKALEAQAQQQQSSLFILGLSALFYTLHKYTGQDDICVGTPVANRRNAAWEDILGFFANVVTLRQRLDNNASLTQLSQQVRDNVLNTFEYQDFPFERVVEHLQPERSLSYSPLFQVMFIFQQEGEAVAVDSLNLAERIEDMGVSKFDFTLTLKRDGDKIGAGIEYSCDIFERDTIERLSTHYCTVLNELVRNSEQSLGSLSVLTAQEQHAILHQFNQTETEYAAAQPAFTRLLAQAELTPNATALSDGSSSWSYQELIEKSRHIAANLQQSGVKTGDRVGIYFERSNLMVASMIAAWQTGAAYVPIDRHFPAQRQAMIAEDADIAVLLTESALQQEAQRLHQQLVLADQLTPALSFNVVPVSPQDLAYVIFTSGSTGRPKGVKVTHQNVQNLLAGLDQRLASSLPNDTATEQPVFRALTSISFDISVLELFWTLARGFHVIVEKDHFSALAQQGQKARQQPRHPKLSALKFSMFYFASDEDASTDKYFLLREGAQFADNNGFSAVWVPERHFHAFGGQFPNPSVAGAAVAALTKNIDIRSGSVVLPLHNPLRVAEEWSMVDNLSNGRVGLAIASGWHFNDFVLMPDNFEQRHDIMKQNITTLKNLWAGEKVTAIDGKGNEAQVRVYPSTIRKQLPIWITAAANPETFRYAGEIGANVLTHLLGQSLTELKEKIEIYRQARQDAGFDPAEGNVTLMLHTYVTDDYDVAMQRVNKPFKDYLRTSINLLLPVAKDNGLDTKEDLESVVEAGFNRYAKTSALFGTPESCLEIVNQAAEIDVDEIGCLIDFGVNPQQVVESFTHLNQLRDSVQNPQDDIALTAQHATHLQCTPSYAQLMLESDAMRESLKQIQGFYVGGEALTPALAEQINALIPGKLFNMYGPTEATVWSAVGEVQGDNANIGLPIANTQIYVLDEQRQPVPFGVKGEMYIAGDGVTAGYWQRDDLTDQAFVADPFNGDGTQKMYRTGDMVRLLATGEMQYLHRRDNQVKVRGFRVELDEIQTALADHELVSQATVIVHQGDNKDASILSYVVPSPAAASTSGEVIAQDDLPSQLLSALKQTLPDYMLPSHVFVLDAMPYTPNGKLDRKALPTQVISAPRKLVPPANDTESRIADIWKQLLNLEDIGTQDSFFELGGHSLLLGRMQQMLKDSFNIDIDVIDLFKYPTIASLAARITSEQAGVSTNKRERRQVNRDAVNQVRNQMRQRNRRGR